MILKEHHKEFAVKAFAQFMPCKQVVSAFIQEFPNDLPKPPKPTQLQLPDASKEEYEEEKEQFVDRYLQKDVYPQYKEEYGENADEQWEKDFNELKAEVEKEYERVCPQDNEELQQLQTWEYEAQLKEHHKQLKIDLSNQLRRFNINHPKFPKKFKSLFEKFRREYYQNFYHTKTDQIAETLSTELNTLYGLAKEKAFMKQDSKNFTKHLDIAHNLLKTIVAYNTLTPPTQGAIETTQTDRATPSLPEPSKQLPS